MDQEEFAGVIISERPDVVNEFLHKMYLGSLLSQSHLTFTQANRDFASHPPLYAFEMRFETPGNLRSSRLSLDRAVKLACLY